MFIWLIVGFLLCCIIGMLIGQRLNKSDRDRW